MLSRFTKQVITLVIAAGDAIALFGSENLDLDGFFYGVKLAFVTHSHANFYKKPMTMPTQAEIARTPVDNEVTITP